MRGLYKKFACVLLVSLAPGLVLAGPVNINTANAETLAMELTGVGPALAAAIVADREANGEFPSPEALTRVRGIGNHVLEANDGNILVSTPEEEESG
ncbi:MAG: helix-hairpin-helix domain-containing protein [Acidobacteria bacterium]|nr:helix-hairpin-helix domain-containing protein [Acidobacteriota bacterium]